MVAINQVCHERQLPMDTVLEAVEIALVSAYKRSYGSNKIASKVDRDSGQVKILVEKEVVEEIFDENNEITLANAQKINSEAVLGDVVQIESTPSDFGRIAAQTTKQVILQRIREAERESLYKSYAEREGEIVNGTVHKIDSHQVILSLGKVEAILPRSEQIPAEKYNASQRLRAYVSEVTRTPRGPQIIVSRTHRNMLRRLLEVEVPEIYNGTVEIKAIAREAGHRSKVAVAALQEGVDPVGSCVGMRGVRIQSIVNELGGEKIDVAEWSSDTRIFIANALSPAKVLNVILQDIGNDKTASVVVPDKQLSLAIGKEGQNARLAAKLTNWRIDIKSVVEAVQDAMKRASASPEVKKLVSHRPEVFSMVTDILAEHKEGEEFSQGGLNLMSEAIDLVGQAELLLAREKYHAVQSTKIETKTAKTEETELETIDIIAQAQTLLEEDLIVEVKEETESETEQPTVEPVLSTTIDTVSIAQETTETIEIIKTTETTEITKEALEEKIEAKPVVEAKVEAEPKPTIAPSKEFLPSILGTTEKPAKKPIPKKRIKPVVVSADPLEELIDKKKAKAKARTLEYDEDLGKVVVKRKRKKSRARDNWEEYID